MNNKPYLTKKFVKYSLIALALNTTTISPTSAGDFFNGMPGPKPAQVDMYAHYADDKTTGTIIPKIFGENFMVAAPFSVSNGEIKNNGINIGHIAKNLFGDMHAITAVGLFTDENGSYNVINPQVYVTKVIGKTSLDADVSIPYNLKTGKSNPSASVTVGYGVNDRLRIGASATKRNGAAIDVEGIVRYELAKDHSYWVQGYVAKNSMGARLVINF